MLSCAHEITLKAIPFTRTGSLGMNLRSLAVAAELWFVGTAEYKLTEQPSGKSITFSKEDVRFVHTAETVAMLQPDATQLADNLDAAEYFEEKKKSLEDQRLHIEALQDQYRKDYDALNQERERLKQALSVSIDREDSAQPSPVAIKRKSDSDEDSTSKKLKITEEKPLTSQQLKLLSFFQRAPGTLDFPYERWFRDRYGFIALWKEDELFAKAFAQIDEMWCKRYQDDTLLKVFDAVFVGHLSMMAVAGAVITKPECLCGNKSGVSTICFVEANVSITICQACRNDILQIYSFLQKIAAMLCALRLMKKRDPGQTRALKFMHALDASFRKLLN